MKIDCHQGYYLDMESNSCFWDVKTSGFVFAFIACRHGLKLHFNYTQFRFGANSNRFQINSSNENRLSPRVLSNSESNSCSWDVETSMYFSRHQEFVSFNKTWILCAPIPIHIWWSTDTESDFLSQIWN